MSDTQTLHFFGGKGGAGKTTLATAFAMNLSDKSPKEKVLLLGFEAGGEALSDLLKKKVAGKPAKLQAGKGEGGLFAVEYDSKGALDAFLKKLTPALEQAAAKGAILSQEDVITVLKQVTTGLDDLAVLVDLVDLIESGEYNRVVVDGAPVSAILRLFDQPVALRKLIALVKGEKPGTKRKEGPPETLLDEVTLKLEKLIATLKDPTKTGFHLVTLPEPVGEAQTRMFHTALRERGIPVDEILVNQVEDGDGCPACQGRRGLQAPHVRKFQAIDKAVQAQLIARRELAPRGLDGVKKLAKEWAANKETRSLEFSAAEGPPALVRAPSMPPIAAPPLPPTRLIFFVGQGGVGKSSCAAAAAVTLTEKEGPVLLISTDPAHSLSDVLQSRLTDTETQVKGTKGLYARELDCPAWFGSLRKRFKDKAERGFEAAGKSAEIAQDREILKNLLDTAPATLDELAAMCALTDALVQERFKRIVVDPTPSATSVRVTDLPPVARAWLTALQTVLTKYKTKGLTDLNDEVAALLRHVKRFEDALASPNESRFVIVTRGEELAQSRTERLVEALQTKKLAAERVLVNRVLPKSTCAKCENRRKLELTVAKNLEKKLALPITVAPALGRHPAGLRELKAFRTSWYALSATTKIKAA
ncbi:MAG: ArsA family ATPase [Myxococcaceae bacterium]